MSDWPALLIMGGSGTGKTTVSGVLSVKYQTRLIHLDRLRKSLQEDSAGHPGSPLRLLLKEDTYRKFSPEELLIVHEKVSRLVCENLTETVSESLNSGEKLIIEGDDLLPSVARKIIEKNKTVRAVCLYNADFAVIKNNIINRDGLREKDTGELFRLQVFHALQNGKKLLQEARENKIACLPSLPWSTLLSRIEISLFINNRG